MIRKLLFTLCLISTISVSGQDTYDIDWGRNSNSNVTPATASTNADRTIEVGDTVRWTWYSTGFHNVVSDAGSQETFTSGSTEGPGTVYSYTFMEIGVNDYFCSPHSGDMFGVITVVADGTLSTKQFDNPTEFNITPNPSQNWLKIKLPTFQNDLNVEVYDVLGKRIYNGKLTKRETSIQVSNWKSGVYLVRVSNDITTHTKRFMKQ